MTYISDYVKNESKQYLEDTVLAWDAKELQIKEKLSPQAAKIRAALQYDEKFADGNGGLTSKRQNLEKGLNYYLTHANIMQEKLIQLTASSAQKVLIGEAIIKMTDRNPDIQEERDIKRKLNYFYKQLEEKNLSRPIYHKEPEGLLEAIKLSANEPSAENSTALRNVIENWMSEVYVPEIPAMASSVEAFNKNRDRQTNALDQYQYKLRDASKLIETYRDRPSDKKNEAVQESMDGLYGVLIDQFNQVEDFRNSLLPELKLQDMRLFDYAKGNLDWGDEFKDYIKPNKLNRDGKHYFRIEDIEKINSDSRYSTHPILEKINNMNGILMNLETHNSHFKNNLQHITINENGIKSSHRTIDKLVRNKGCDWDRMADLSRINTVFHNADTQFFFNKVLKEQAVELGWDKVAKDGFGARGDKSIRAVNTGTINHNVVLNHFFEGIDGGTGLMAECKLDTSATQVVEKFVHPLYALSRILESEDSRQCDVSQLTESQIDRFFQQAKPTIDRLLHYAADLPSEYNLNGNQNLKSTATQYLENIQSDLKLYHDNPDILPKVYDELLDAQTIITFTAAKLSKSNSIAALHAVVFDEFSQETEPKNIAKQRTQLEHLPDGNAKDAAMENLKLRQKRLDRMVDLYELHGPQQKETLYEPGAYTKADYEHAKVRIEQHRAEMEMNKPHQSLQR